MLSALLVLTQNPASHPRQSNHHSKAPYVPCTDTHLAIKASGVSVGRRREVPGRGGRHADTRMARGSGRRDAGRTMRWLWRLGTRCCSCLTIFWSVSGYVAVRLVSRLAGGGNAAGFALLYPRNVDLRHPLLPDSQPPEPSRSKNVLKSPVSSGGPRRGCGRGHRPRTAVKHTDFLTGRPT
ncbi:hypothetical protein LX36DRAFT_456996 [Colletotrichum falcatum]|nr:hypothetical protein LX36DRAFT_456996 [Colletotrichum falcatum]